MSSFGASGPYQKLYEHFQITSAKIVAEAESLIHHLA
jgi:transketolase